jgi:4-hydroxybenzoate polyprenyltransferase
MTSPQETDAMAKGSPVSCLQVSCLQASSLPDTPVVSRWNHLLQTHTPAFAKPYVRLARLDRPIGFWLLFLPCGWSLALASGIQQKYSFSLAMLLLLAIGALVMRGAGCTYNDILDRDIDAKVARTRLRPLPAGEVSVKSAIVFACVLALLGLVILLQFNRFSIFLGLLSLIPVAIYPVMKRIMPLPQLVLGMAFAWGALMGWAVILGSLDWPPVLLYLGTLAWVVGYDTLYALQDMEDDALVGVHSSALFFGEHTPFAITCCYAVASLLITAAIFKLGATPLGYLGSALFAWHLLRQIKQISPQNDGDTLSPAKALSVFRSNKTAGLLLLIPLLLDALMKNYYG